jgi:hypothetical protein
MTHSSCNSTLCTVLDIWEACPFSFSRSTKQEKDCRMQRLRKQTERKRERKREKEREKERERERKREREREKRKDMKREEISASFPLSYFILAAAH